MPSATPTVVQRASMPKVTLYVKDSDATVWDRARVLVSGGDEDSLSSLVTEALSLLVDRREREREAEKVMADRLESVELDGVDGRDPNIPRRIRFKGMLAHESRDTSFYVTKGKQIVAETQAGDHSAISVFENFDELKTAVDRGGSWKDDAVLDAVAQALGEDYYEDID